MLLKKVFIILIVVAGISIPAYSQENLNKGEHSKIDFKWESVDWATAYEVEVKDALGKIVLKKTVSESRIEFSLPPGLYSIRIGVYDRFDKLAAWSDWQMTEIRKKEPYSFSALNLGIKLSGGSSYIQYIGMEISPFENTYRAYSAKIGFNFGEFILFQPSKKIKYMGFMRHFGFEIEGMYVSNAGKDLTGIVDTDMTGKYIGGNLFFTTGFNFPVNIILRAGGGAVRSKFLYDTLPEKTSVTSEDPFYKGGISLEWTFLRYFFLEAGADYLFTSYIDFQLKSVRYYALLGIKI